MFKLDLSQFEYDSVAAWNTLPTSTKEALINPTAETLGKALDGAATVICSPLLFLGIATKAEIKKFSREINQKLGNIPNENHDLSKEGLVIKAMEEARYQLNQDDIRRMYVNLIASTVDDRKSDMVNPRIASCLSQMGPKEARFVELLTTQKDHKLLIGQGWLENHTKGYDYYAAPIIVVDNDLNVQLGYISSIDILESLGIIKTFKRRRLTETKFQSQYNFIQETLQPLEKNKENNEAFDIRLGYIDFTNFGDDFRQCIS